MTDDILVSTQDGIATVTFNRPRQRNAISYHGWLELRRIAMDLDRDPGVRVVMFTGAGDAAFSAGADIKDFENYRDNSEKAAVYAETFDGAMDAIEAMSKPTICLIKGFCVGGGCELSMATDIRIAADNSRFGIPVARLSILVGYKEMRRLVQLVGPGNASYILLSARLLDAEEAHRIGLVTQVAPLEEVSGVAYDLAREMVAARAAVPDAPQEDTPDGPKEPGPQVSIRRRRATPVRQLRQRGLPGGPQRIHRTPRAKLRGPLRPLPHRLGCRPHTQYESLSDPRRYDIATRSVSIYGDISEETERFCSVIGAI